jgi:uncharacterized protein YdhG (YjbR/CyaY superfamily)
MMTAIKTIDAYIATFPAPVQMKLKKLRRTIRDLAPKATEAMKYGMPTFVLGKNLVHFAAYKNHIGFYPTPSAIVAFKKQLATFVTSKGAIQFPVDEPIPLSLVEKIVRFRVKENMGRINVYWHHNR